MPELRWILVIAGLLLIAGLWWWETRRKARALQETAATPEPEEADEEVDIRVAVRREATAEDEDLPSIRATRRERGATGRNPPITEIPEDVEPELARPRPDELDRELELLSLPAPIDP